MLKLTCTFHAKTHGGTFFKSTILGVLFLHVYVKNILRVESQYNHHKQLIAKNYYRIFFAFVFVKLRPKLLGKATYSNYGV